MIQRILVIGGLGFLGGRITQYLLSKNYEVVIATSRNLKLKENYLGCKTVKISWQISETIEFAIKGVDYIIHTRGANARDCVLRVAPARLHHCCANDDTRSRTTACGVCLARTSCAALVLGDEAIASRRISTKAPHACLHQDSYLLLVVMCDCAFMLVSLHTLRLHSRAGTSVTTRRNHEASVADTHCALGYNNPQCKHSHQR